ncbi:hypothetical protein PM082_017808 [Marasmius tenuissimus]|nr:hypothetical protein PM082_017808 [Marasmius tenuissimus]
MKECSQRIPLTAHGLFWPKEESDISGDRRRWSFRLYYRTDYPAHHPYLNQERSKPLVKGHWTSIHSDLDVVNTPQEQLLPSSDSPLPLLSNLRSVVDLNRQCIPTHERQGLWLS